MMFLVQFLFVALKLKDSRVLEKEIGRKHANIRKRTASESYGANLTKWSCILTSRDGAGTEVYIVVDKHRK